MNNKIYHKGFCSILFFLTEELFIGLGIPHILSISKQSSYISIIVSCILSLFIFFIFYKLFQYKKDENIFKKFESVYGKMVGKIFNFILIILAFFYFVFSLWLLVIYIQNKYLNETPNYIIVILYLIPVIYIVNKNMKTISKVSLICFIFSILEILLSIFGLIGLVEIDNLKPFSEVPIPDILKSSYYCISYFITPIFLLLCVPSNQIDEPKKCKKNFLIFYFLAYFNLFILLLFIISIFGIDLAKLYYYPEFALLEKISYFNFLEHVENILSTQWMIGLFLNSVMSLYFIKTYLNHNKISKQKIYYIIIFVALLLSLTLFKNTTEAFNFLKSYLTFIFTIPIIVLMAITLFLSKRKKEIN